MVEFRDDPFPLSEFQIEAQKSGFKLIDQRHRIRGWSKEFNEQDVNRVIEHYLEIIPESNLSFLRGYGNLFFRASSKQSKPIIDSTKWPDAIWAFLDQLDSRCNSLEQYKEKYANKNQKASEKLKSAIGILDKAIEVVNEYTFPGLNYKKDGHTYSTNSTIGYLVELRHQLNEVKLIKNEKEFHREKLRSYAPLMAHSKLFKLYQYRLDDDITEAQHFMRWAILDKMPGIAYLDEDMDELIKNILTLYYDQIIS